MVGVVLINGLRKVYRFQKKSTSVLMRITENSWSGDVGKSSRFILCLRSHINARMRSNKPCGTMLTTIIIPTSSWRKIWQCMTIGQMNSSVTKRIC